MQVQQGWLACETIQYDTSIVCTPALRARPRWYIKRLHYQWIYLRAQLALYLLHLRLLLPVLFCEVDKDLRELRSDSVRRTPL